MHNYAIVGISGYNHEMVSLKDGYSIIDKHNKRKSGIYGIPQRFNAALNLYCMKSFPLSIEYHVYRQGAAGRFTEYFPGDFIRVSIAIPIGQDTCK